MIKTTEKLIQIWGWFRGRLARALLYHAISQDANDPFSVRPDIFDKQLEWVAANDYQIISHRQFITRLANHQPLARCLILTFDDGLENFYDNALPLLKKYGFQAIVFLPTAMAGALSNWGAQFASYRIMSRAQVLSAIQAGCEIGSHSARHYSMPDLPTNLLAQELEESLAFIRSLPGNQPACLAYPFGRGNAREQEIACQSGYTSAYSSGGLWGNGPGSNLFALNRYPIHRETDFSQFQQITSGAADLRMLLHSIRVKPSSHIIKLESI